MLRTLVLFYIVAFLASRAALSQQAATASAHGGAITARDTDDVKVLKQVSESFEQIAQRSGRGVVQIFARTYSRQSSADTDSVLVSENSTASGVVLTPDGYILTNAHVVRGAHNIRVHITNADPEEAIDSVSRSLPATLVGMDSDTDLAVIKVDKPNLPYLSFADPARLKQGELVLALGSPLGLDGSVTFGVVSATSRQLKPDDPMVYIQTDAPINPGN